MKNCILFKNNYHLFLKKRVRDKKIRAEGEPDLLFYPFLGRFCAICIFYGLFMTKISTKTTANKCCNLERFMI